MRTTDSPREPAALDEARAGTLTAQERNQWLDHEWVLGDAEVQSRYAGSVIAVSNRTILGVGSTPLAALQAAQTHPDCPPRNQIVIVPVEGRPLGRWTALDSKE